tara:strand:- start:2994 stop:3248 length:255 start_codon:yes stop_codon:yes gene_type:complete
MVNKKIAKLKRVKRTETLHLVGTDGQSIHSVANNIIWKTIRPSLDDLQEMNILTLQKKKVINMMIRQSMEAWTARGGNEDGTEN